VSVRFILDVRVKPGCRDDLLRAYAALRERVEREPELVGHQLCESIDDPERWLVISEWTSLEASTAWDRSEEHGRLIGPMRACFAQAGSTKFHVRDGVRAHEGAA
jgi:heme oxygenase (mycobilin-producing)